LEWEILEVSHNERKVRVISERGVKVEGCKVE
jgi:hypothetical protein